MPRSPRVEPSRRRKQRSRPTPRWLTKRTDLDAIARTRLLMVLSVLSGETPVTTAIERGGISRGFYYQLETKAINAMLLALAPGSDGDPSSDASSTTRRIADLEDKVIQLEQEKRRAERLLFLTRKVVRPGPMKTAKGRPPKTTSSTSAGKAPSMRSVTKPMRPRGATTSSPTTSIPTPAGGSAVP